ncbi:hypothetical protein [Salmonella enterica]|uniref:hypothetical protein n=1 Tax=Salmonella enterica TaxID=28901 RepID=UPI0009B12379|nr:hypothetical protein [Salmonella enterica]EAB6710792.1 hypothetical protein [Salmonella enterica subsp. enterica serovar Tokoin]EBF8131937.1 hypothetical protein [Salmonella enterica subsp. enterica]ELD3827475.1 hypothetical protein [Salmonella enterica]ELD5408230.1 hypothetical protein [Salmonella enterica]OZT96291.1 hypothetical protein CCO44_21460 [Salmonella enterica subsp. enterica serovar Glostrup]
MKLQSSCPVCLKEFITNQMIGTSESSLPMITNLSSVGFREDGRYEMTCLKGHTSITFLQQQKFEILFDIGAYAIIDGYYREAVSSFTSSLERFYEFFIKVVCISKGISESKVVEAWKEVSNQSERQLGVFIFLHLLELGCKPNLLNNNKIKFRNGVIHKGMIPSEEQALEYGQAVLDMIRPLLKILKENYSEAISTAVFQYLNSVRNPSDVGVPVSTMCLTTILSLSYAEPAHETQSLNEAISQLKNWKSIVENTVFPE